MFPQAAKCGRRTANDHSHKLADRFEKIADSVSKTGDRLRAEPHRKTLPDVGIAGRAGLSRLKIFAKAHLSMTPI